MCWQPVQRNQALCWVWSSSTIGTEVQIPDTQLLFQTCLLWLPLPAACVWLRQHMEHGTELTQPLISDVVPDVPCSGCCPEAVLLVPCKLHWETVRRARALASPRTCQQHIPLPGAFSGLVHASPSPVFKMPVKFDCAGIPQGVIRSFSTAKLNRCNGSVNRAGRCVSIEKCNMTQHVHVERFMPGSGVGVLQVKA